MSGRKETAEAVERPRVRVALVGERSNAKKITLNVRSETVSSSSENAGRNPALRKLKGSSGRLVRGG